MTFQPLKEKGIPLEKQIRNWEQVVKSPYNKTAVDCYTRTRQILMNGIEVEAWNYKHAFSRFCPDTDTCKLISNIRRIEDAQQTTINWLAPADQSVLETTLGYEQVAVDLTAWLAQNEPDFYVKETFDFGLLEDFDHLYRYSQWAYMTEGIDPNDIVQENTDVILGRPTQNHHNDNAARIRKAYDKNTASPQTKVNILTLVSAEQQTHNYYAEHGFNYANDVLRKTYAEIKDVEEEHVSMYESLIDSTETLYEKLLIHEFCEVCNYYTCYEDETNSHLKKIWELFLEFELAHLQIASDLIKKYEKRDPEEIVGSKIIIPSRFKSQKDYVAKVLTEEIDKRLDAKADMGYIRIKELPENWASYKVQKEQGELGSPTEETIKLMEHYIGRDIVRADESLIKQEFELLDKGLEKKALAPNTVFSAELKDMVAEYENKIQSEQNAE